MLQKTKINLTVLLMCATTTTFAAQYNIWFHNDTKETIKITTDAKVDKCTTHINAFDISLAPQANAHVIWQVSCKWDEFATAALVLQYSDNTNGQSIGSAKLETHPSFQWKQKPVNSGKFLVSGVHSGGSASISFKDVNLR